MALSRFEQQMQFILEIDKLKTVFRQNYLTDGSRKENDTEHSWHLAMMVIVLSEHFEQIDILKTLKMVLIHDIVEIYAGDTFAYDELANLDKEDREKKSAERIFSLLPSEQAEEFTGIWQEFERMETYEAIYAAIFDRIHPLIMNISSKGKMWHEHEITIEKVLKRNKIVFDKAPEIISQYVQNQISEACKKQYFHCTEKS